MSKSLHYKLGNLIKVNSRDAAVRLNISKDVIDLLTMMDSKQIDTFFKDANISTMPIKQMFNLEKLKTQLKNAQNFERFRTILEEQNANIFSEAKLKKIYQNFADHKTINDAIEAVTEWDTKFKKIWPELVDQPNVFISIGVFDHYMHHTDY
ncbi:hypothetical protein [Mycoplasma amphoriforme]|uniref:Uncharacterized protein n=1 Tax=Mycoplasma amphoriforme A39 TaxID=572419 RepID=A0A292II23_9MOLU|nr:unnamed protein product [Mycoplasma amphoriforme A39]